jgi:tRNA-specific 2-thiouridylase
MNMNIYNRKVLLGMSGGVDSTAAAVILQQNGYEVIGVTFVQTSFEEMEAAISDAKKTADVLGIEHYVLDLRREFKEDIIKYFHSEYDRGRTPNPCVKCNQIIKYKKFLEEADRLGARYISSGQYAKIVLEDGRYLIKKAENKFKDQSYYLYNLKEKDLERILMPL